MPLTIAHPLAVVPLRRLGVRWHQSLAAPVAGSMVPDLPLYDGASDWMRQYELTHSWHGVLIADLPLGLIAVVLWWYLMRGVLVDIAPAVIRDRLAPDRLPTRGEWLTAVPGVLVGAMTHIVWDDFTHEDRWGVRHIAWLQERHGGEPGWQWAQYGSGIVGTAALVVLALVWLRRQPVRPLGDAAAPTLRRRVVLGPWAVVVVAAAALVAAGLGVHTHAGGDLHAKVYAATIAAIATGVVTLLVLGAVWRVLVSSRARRRG